MLHKPKISTLKHLHSIPRYFMHSIPIGSIVALLTLNLILINPVIQSQTYALEEDIGRNTESSTLTTEKENNNITNSSSTHSSVRDTATNDNEEVNNDLDTVEREDSTVSKAKSTNVPTGKNINPSATLTITPGDGGHGAGASDTVTIVPGKTAYRSHNITIDVRDSTNYTLQLNSANKSADLKLDGGNFVLNGATGQTGAGLEDYTWGFSWGNTSDDDSSLRYYTLPVYGTSGQNLQTGRLEAGSGGSVSFTKKLVFAAKFGSNALVGHYKANAILSLAASPLGVTKLADVGYMQQMTPEICINSSKGDSATNVIDIRDNSKYSIAKIDDDKCWMTSNLRLVDKTLTSDDSNVSSSGYVVPQSEVAPWGESAGNSTQKVIYNNNEKYGAYYSWCAATAGSCSLATTKDSIAPYSICPKGWRLPTWAEYNTLKSLGYSSLTDIKVNDGITMGGAFFPASGSVWYGNWSAQGAAGEYWTSTGAGGYQAYPLTFNQTHVTTNNFSGVTGFSVRCIAI